MNKKNLKLAIQKSGRLTADTLNLLRSAGLEFESYRSKLFSSCRNFPLEIVYLRDDDIADYVASGSVDLGILGQNLLYEERPPNLKKLLDLGFGFCTLTLAVPKESAVQSLVDLAGCKIATTYPNSTQDFFKQNALAVETIKITGSVEIAPMLGVAEAIADISATGSTMALNDLRPLTKIYDSQAVLIANEQSLLSENKRQLIDRLQLRFQGVLAAKNYKYVMMNAPEKILPKITKITPGLKSPTIAPLALKGWISLQTVIREDIFWETIEKLKSAGASGIIILAIEKIIL